MGLRKEGIVWPGNFKILAMPKFTQPPPPKFGGFECQFDSRQEMWKTLLESVSLEYY